MIFNDRMASMALDKTQQTLNRIEQKCFDHYLPIQTYEARMRTVIVSAAILAMLPTHAEAEFVGTLAFKPVGCQNKGSASWFMTSPTSIPMVPVGRLKLA